MLPMPARQIGHPLPFRVEMKGCDGSPQRIRSPARGTGLKVDLIAAIPLGVIMENLTGSSTLDTLSGRGTAILLKHGATCPISSRARDEVAAFAEAHPDVPIFELEVTGNRELSAQVASQLGVTHQSPQVFVLRDGKVTWHAEHYDITARSLASQTASG
jgi:bacillithiol system protein YtxJ